MNNFPKITIVTPSFNQGKFIEETILSVIGQGYPNLEYIIMDGGSTDETISIIEKYKDKITYWESKKDNGQSHAINKGFAKASGDILGWLNSDDMLLPGTLLYVSRQLNPDKNQFLCGNCVHFEEGSIKLYGSKVKILELNDQLFGFGFIQPSTFWTRKLWLENGNLNEDWHYVFDCEWFYRLRDIKDVELFSTNKYLSMYRLHDSHKTGTGGSKRQEEIAKLFSFRECEVLT